MEETGLSLFQRSRHATFSPKFSIFENGISPTDIIEITGLPSTGKTSMLMTLAAHFVHPLHHGEVLYFDLEHNLSLSDFKTCVEESCNNNNRLMEEMLSNIHIRQCTSSFENIVQLKAFVQRQTSTSRPLLILIDSINAFMSIERMMAHMVGDGTTMTKQWFQTIRQIVADTAAIVIATKTVDVIPNMSSESMPSEWNNIVNRKYWTTAADENMYHIHSNTQHSTLLIPRNET